jgi:hypothetical protein
MSSPVDNSPDECGICMETTTESLMRPHAGAVGNQHWFHPKCLKEWINTKLATPSVLDVPCPTCGKAVDLTPFFSWKARIARKTKAFASHALVAGVGSALVSGTTQALTRSFSAAAVAASPQVVEVVSVVATGVAGCITCISPIGALGFVPAFGFIGEGAPMVVGLETGIIGGVLLGRVAKATGFNEAAIGVGIGSAALVLGLSGSLLAGSLVGAAVAGSYAILRPQQ